MKLLTSLTAAVALLVGASAVHASVSITIIEAGEDLAAYGSGSINTTGLNSLGVLNSTSTGLQASTGYLSGGPTSSTGSEIFSGISGPSNFGLGSLQATANTGGGDRFMILGSTQQLGLPVSYTSGTSLGFSTRWINRDLEDFGLTQGEYTWTWGSGANADSVTINVLPEPGTYAIIAGVLALGLAAWRRRRG